MPRTHIPSGNRRRYRPYTMMRRDIAPGQPMPPYQEEGGHFLQPHHRCGVTTRPNLPPQLYARTVMPLPPMSVATAWPLRPYGTSRVSNGSGSVKNRLPQHNGSDQSNQCNRHKAFGPKRQQSYLKYNI